MTELIHTIKPEDLTSEGKLRDDFVPDGVKEHVRKEGIDPNNVGYIYVGGTKDDPMSHGIHLHEPYKIVYKNSRKPKRKIIKEFSGYGLVGGLSQLEKSFRRFVEENRDIPNDEVNTFFRDWIKGIVETWGCQKMGLSTLMTNIPKEVKRDMKKDKDMFWISLVLGFYCKNFISKIEEDNSKEGCRTLTITDKLVTDEMIEKSLLNLNPKKYPNPLTDEEKDEMRYGMKNYGMFTYEYSS